MTEEKKGSKRKILIIIIAAIAILSVVFVVLYFLIFKKSDSTKSVFISKVSEITGSSDLNWTNRYMGVVESQETKEINLEQGRELLELFVEVGDSVNAGDKLFSYSTDDIERRMAQTNIEIERMRNSINSSRVEIKILEEERARAAAENQIDYTLQIQSLLAGIAQTEYSIKTKQVEYDQLKKSYDNSVVYAPLEGTVQSINKEDTNDPYTGNTLPFIVIMKGGDFLIKGTVSEINIYSIYEGMAVIIRSRVDESRTWDGTIIKVDTSKPQDDSQSSMYYYGGPAQDSRASKYSFYVELASIKGLMIGQHVTIEMKDEASSEPDDGLRLYSFYICDLDSDPYVFADNGRGRIEKRRVLLGEYDEDSDRYEILNGLSFEDFIAYPDPTVFIGQKTTKEMMIFSKDEYLADDPIVMQDGMSFAEVPVRGK